MSKNNSPKVIKVKNLITGNLLEINEETYQKWMGASLSIVTEINEDTLFDIPEKPDVLIEKID